MTQEQKDGIPDLRDVTAAQLAALGDTSLAHCIALYRERLRESGTLTGKFNSNI
jgi:hypothetical protein